VSTLDINERVEPDMDLYPNPTNGSVVVHVGSPLLGARYQIVDPTGRTMLQGAILAAHATISLEQLPAGMYFMRFPERNGLVRKIMKE
jgi:hypothetical protein